MAASPGETLTLLGMLLAALGTIIRLVWKASSERAVIDAELKRHDERLKAIDEEIKLLRVRVHKLAGTPTEAHLQHVEEVVDRYFKRLEEEQKDEQ